MRERRTWIFVSSPRGSGTFLAKGRRRLLAVAAVAATSTALTACGGGGSSSASGDSGGGGSTPHVLIGKAVDTIGFTTVDVAQGKGYFAKQGVGVKEELLGGSSTAFAALQSGSVQFVTASSSALLKAKVKGVPLEAVASLDYGVSLQLCASNNWIKKHHLSLDQPVNEVMKGLTGATLGVISTTDKVYYKALEQAAGVDPGKFKEISFKTQSAALAALQHGQIDAFLLSPPISYQAQEQKSAQIVATLHSLPQLANMTYDILVTDSGYAKDHPDVVKSVATAMAMADATMASDPNSVLDIERKHFPTFSDQVLLQSLKYVTFTRDGKMSEDTWKAAKSQAVSSGVEGVSSVDVSSGAGVWTNDYIKSQDVAAVGSGSGAASSPTG
jgi:ABC-type nitrate/sulfonate/bicarbonate transport system substrate-binding protein